MKTAIVTGASGNLGQAVVKKFINEGFNVVGTTIANDSYSPDFPKETFEKVVVDLTDESASQKFIDSATAKYGNVEVAVLTVGGFAMGSIKQTSIQDILEQIHLNFETAYNVARPVFMQMVKQNGGRIFIIGSKPGLNAKNGKGMVAYGLSKSLLFRLSELLNDEGHNNNVVTSVIVPSTIDTPQNRKSMPDADYTKWVKAEQIADAIYFYSSDGASAIREPIIKMYNNA